MIFDALDDNAWVPDHEEWEEYNRNNLEQRKQEWKNITPILKQFAFMTSVKTGYLTVHKSLFFKGRLPSEYKVEISKKKNPCIEAGDKLFYCFPLFYLWYHPMLNEQVIENLFEKLTTDPFVYRRPDYISAEGISSMLRSFFRVQNEYDAFKDYGMMGGREEILAPYFLLGSKNGTVENSFRTGWFNPSLKTLLSGMFPGTWVLQGKYEDKKLGQVYSVNPYGTGQYVWAKVSKYIERHFNDEIHQAGDDRKYDVKLKFIDDVIERVLFFDEHPKTVKEDPFAIACRDRLLSQYRNNELADWLSERFVKRDKLGLEVS
ncbi:hypothetical protein [Arenicella xantha]|uniref:hypothetical protein n=1 Tax=Arenicella xantha TaxID=644221 RepID=UPI0011BF0B22|nr:hypothetical protein [Arenicella xantha]